MKPRRIAFAAGMAVVGLVAAAAIAHAATVAQPGTVNFPERQTGTTSDPQNVTVTVICTTYRPDINPGAPCLTQDTFTRNPQITGANAGDFFAEAGGTCPAQLGPLITQPAVQCTIPVRFKPTAAGPRTATFIAGTGNTGGPNAVELKGTATITGQRAAALAKCKKKKAKQKRKKCRANAQKLPE